MENQNTSRATDPELKIKGEKDRRKSDFLSRYEELTCKAALAIKSVDQIVKLDRKPQEFKNNENNRNELNTQPLDSPITPEVEFNEEEVLRTCQDFLEDYDRRAGQARQPAVPVPAPRLSLTAARTEFPSQQHCPVARQLSREDEQLLQAAQGKSFWENQSENLFEKIDNVNPEVFDSKIIRTRSSSLTIHDKSEEKIKPILKKSTEDLAEHNKFPSILKTRDDFGLNQKSKVEGKCEHVRIQSPSFDRNDHIRIRSPSPDFEQEIIDIEDDDELLFNDRSSSPEIPSILKNRFRRTSVDAISIEELQQDSEEPQSILKRKASFGSGSHSPEGNSEHTKSILKSSRKSSRNSSRTCSRSGSTEELDLESTKSILKSRNSSRTCSRSGSQEELDLDLEDEWESNRPKSILKKKQGGSTDDELEDHRDPARPKSILKSRRSEESLSPHSCELTEQGGGAGILLTARPLLDHQPDTDTEEINMLSGRSSPLVQEVEQPRPAPSILRNREEPAGPASILKWRERSPGSPAGSPPPSRSTRSLARHQQVEQSPTGLETAAGPPDPLRLSLSDRVRLFERGGSSGSAVRSLPPQGAVAGAVAGAGRRARRGGRPAARFQTQPITVDEVEAARRDCELSLRPNQFLNNRISFSPECSGPGEQLFSFRRAYFALH